MLSAKTASKDRWQQVLSKAMRILDKHLLTLEPGISENQTDQMRTSRLQLVVPRGIHETYGGEPAEMAYVAIRIFGTRRRTPRNLMKCPNVCIARNRATNSRAEGCRP